MNDFSMIEAKVTVYQCDFQETSIMRLIHMNQATKSSIVLISDI